MYSNCWTRVSVGGLTELGTMETRKGKRVMS